MMVLSLFLSLFAGFTALATENDPATKMVLGGEGVGGGDAGRVSRRGPGTSMQWEFRTPYGQSRGPVWDLASFIESIRMGLEVDEQRVRESLIKVVANGGPTIGKTKVSVEEAVDEFLQVYKEMEGLSQAKTGLSLDEYLKQVQVEKVEQCFDNTGASVDMCTELFDIAAPIYITIPFLRKNTEEPEVQSGLFYHELTRKLLGTVDDNHVHASVVRLAILFYRDGFFTQGACFVQDISCTNHDVELSVVGIGPIVIPFVDYACVENKSNNTTWYFDLETVFAEGEDSVDFQRNYSSPNLRFYKEIEKNIGVERGQLTYAHKDIAGRFEFVMIADYQPEDGYPDTKLQDFYGCSAFASKERPKTEVALGTVHYEKYISAINSWMPVCYNADNPLSIDKDCVEPTTTSDVIGN